MTNEEAHRHQLDCAREDLQKAQERLTRAESDYRAAIESAKAILEKAAREARLRVDRHIATAGTTSLFFEVNDGLQVALEGKLPTAPVLVDNPWQITVKRKFTPVAK